MSLEATSCPEETSRIVEICGRGQAYVQVQVCIFYHTQVKFPLSRLPQNWVYCTSAWHFEAG